MKKRDHILIQHSTLTDAIDGSERKDLIHRVISQRDRRSFELQLTNEGLSIREEHSRADKQIESFVIDPLDNEQEQEMIIKLLSKILGNIGYNLNL